MSEKNKIAVFEHDRLTTENSSKFLPRHLAALERFYSQSQINFFSLIRKGVKFNQFVGVIQAGDLTIEVLPKADAESTVNDELKGRWRKVLLQMLRECKILKVNRADNANLSLRANSLLEIYFELLLSEVEQLLQNGLVKKYKKCAGNILSLKGRLDFAKNLAHNAVHQERFYTHYTTYSTENIFNQVVLEAVKLIPKISSNPLFADRVNRIILNFPELPKCSISEDTFSKLKYDRKTERYREAILISKMLLLNFRPDISGGSDNLISIMFDMNKLWEEFIYRRLKREEEKVRIKVSRQSYIDFWKPENQKSKAVRPDIVIESGNRKIVIDTKWKTLKDKTPSDQDLKQMFVYNLFWKCGKSYLLYPGNVEGSGGGNYHCHIYENNFQSSCGIEIIQILSKDNLLKENLGMEILTKIDLNLEQKLQQHGKMNVISA